MRGHILAHDLGTTGDKATIYNKKGGLINSTFSDYVTYRPHNGWAEQDPRDWWQAVCNSTKKLLDQTDVNKDSIDVISFSGQMMGCLPLNKKGEPLRRAIIWADRRSVTQAEELKNKIGMDQLYKITGHRISPNYSLTKIMWVMKNEPEVYKNTHKFVHSKDYIVNKLTGQFATDYSDASGMNLYDIREKRWSPNILKASGLEREKLPSVHSSFDVIGEVTRNASKEIGLSPGTPVVLGAGDGSAATVGAAVVSEGRAYNYIGSSSWIGLATKEPIFDPDRKTFNWIHMDPNMYVPCGTMQSAGASFSWLKDTLCLLEEDAARDLDLDPYELMNLSVKGSEQGAGNLIYLPYLQGERSPLWNPNAKGAFIGLTIRHDRKDIIRSVVEGISFNLKIISEIFKDKTSFSQIKLIGGGAKSPTWCQILADIYDKEVQIPRVIEGATSLGAAIAGGVGVEIFDSLDVSSEINPVKNVQKPDEEAVKKYADLFPVFKESYRSLVDVFDSLEAVDDKT